MIKDNLDLLETRINRLLGELGRLRGENRKLFTEIQVGLSSDKIPDLKAENETLKAEHKALTAENEAFKKERELLKVRINQMLEQLEEV